MSNAIDCVYSIEGSGPPIFMVHGIGARRQGWNRIVEQLRDRFQCITYDLRGHGESPLPKKPFGLDELVADLEALRARLGIEAAHVIGHSLGGMIGPAYARAYPDRVLSLGLLSTAAFRTDDDRAKVKAVVAAMEEKGIPQVLETLTERWFTDAFAAAHPEVIEARKRQVVETNPEVFLNVFHIYAETEMKDWLPEIKAPSLVLTGELDGGCNPRLNKQIADALPNSELVILDGLKHAILIEASERVVPHLARFLTAHSRGRAHARPRSVGNSKEAAMSDDFSRGLDVRRQLFGEERTATAFARDDQLTSEFQRLITSYCFGSLWGKEGPKWRDRSLMTLCLVAAQHRFAEFETHMRLAVRNGCDQDILIEVVRHITVYCGVPTGVEAFRIAQKIFDEPIAKGQA